MIDTTGLSAAMLRRRLAGEMLVSDGYGSMSLTFESFGFKYGTGGTRT